MKKIFCLIFAFLFLSNFSFAVESVKIVYIGESVGSSIERAIFNGARDAFGELEKRYGKKIDFNFINATDLNSQIVELGKSYVNGAKGAILFPVKSFGEHSPQIDGLVEKNFHIAFVGRDIPKSKGVCFVGGDESKLRALASSELKRLMGKKKKSIFIYGKETDGKTEEESRDAVMSYAENIFGSDLLQSLSQGNTTVELMPLYSIYATVNKTSILRRDDYAEIFVSPDLLSDTAPIKFDGDRAFTLCVGALPSLARYLEAGELTSCVYHDYYGWGYFAARTLVEKIIDNLSPNQRVRLLKPLLSTPDTAQSFKKDWHNWTK